MCCKLVLDSKMIFESMRCITHSSKRTKLQHQKNSKSSLLENYSLRCQNDLVSLLV